MQYGILCCIIAICLHGCASSTSSHQNQMREEAKTLRHMAAMTAEHGDYARAADLYDKAQHMDPKNKDMLQFAKVQLLSGQTAAAIKTYRKILKKDPDALDARQGLAKAYFTRGNVDKAMTQWKKILNKHPKDHDALNGIGLVMESLKHYTIAEACFKKGLQAAPEDFRLINNAALTYALQGRVSEGLNTLRQLQKSQSNDRIKNNIALLSRTDAKEIDKAVLSMLPKADPTLGRKTLVHIEAQAASACG